MMENSDDDLDSDSGYQAPYQPYEPPSAAQPVEAELATEPVEAQLASDVNSASQPPSRRPLSIGGYISWLVVLGLALGISSLVATTQFLAEEEIGGDAGPLDTIQIQLQGKFVVGQRELAKAAPGAPTNPIPDELNSGCYEQRICYAIILNEVESPAEALEYLEDLDAKVEEHELELTEDQTRMRRVVQELLGNYDSGNPDSDALPESTARFFKTSSVGWANCRSTRLAHRTQPNARRSWRRLQS